MPTPSPFETQTAAYDDWFDANDGVYRTELAALECALEDVAVDADTQALEVGVGTGRFAAPLDIPVGIDPAQSPLERATDRGVSTARGVVESLPVADNALNLLLFVTVLSFVDDLEAALQEARRVLASDGTLVIAILDRASPGGQVYQEHKDEDPFYADAEFLRADEVCTALEEAGFTVEQRLQAVFGDPTEIDADAEPDVREGHGDGLFAVIRADPTGV
ncbi:methyltransferase domain-containing protein [Natronolimnobius sp. AArcel1]|uniref:class I SAM-dependent methyltransferase n=1 Tax=Natronolimnobius sp. AArcel1 TaxID=1679093 RepID=UPI0013EB71E7|nr:class I SAM-dependent methyltransferase [Natronolimnobius sp. AArcel1]NGM68319.1 methyltransferase domain-containing protein [Natronolimnobius sp. AArcel1]